MGKSMKVVLECISVKGTCRFYKIGDKVTFAEPAVLLDETDAFCVGGMCSIIPYYRPLCHGVKPEEMGLTKGIIGCHAPPLGSRPEAHGMAFFKIKQIPLDDPDAITETPIDKIPVEKWREQKRKHIPITKWQKDITEKGIKGDKVLIREEYWPEHPDMPFPLEDTTMEMWEKKQKKK